MNRSLALILAGVTVVALGAGSPLLAQNPDYVLDLTDATGDVGAQATVNVVLDDPMGEALAGWSWSCCQDNDNVLITVNPKSTGGGGGGGPGGGDGGPGGGGGSCGKKNKPPCP